MLYAQIGNHKSKSIDWPPKWEKCKDMFDYLRRMTWNYQLTIELRMFYSDVIPEHRCVLVRWGGTDATTGTGKRDVLLETTDHTQMEAALFMLINEVEAEHKAAKGQVSMVP